MAGASLSCQDSNTPRLNQGHLSDKAFQLMQVERVAGGTVRYAKMLRAPSPAGKYLFHLPRLRTLDSVLHPPWEDLHGSQLVNGDRFFFYGFPFLAPLLFNSTGRSNRSPQSLTHHQASLPLLKAGFLVSKAGFELTKYLQMILNSWSYCHFLSFGIMVYHGLFQVRLDPGLHAC